MFMSVTSQSLFSVLDNIKLLLNLRYTCKGNNLQTDWLACGMNLHVSKFWSGLQYKVLMTFMFINSTTCWTGLVYCCALLCFYTGTVVLAMASIWNTSVSFGRFGVQGDPPYRMFTLNSTSGIWNSFAWHQRMLSRFQWLGLRSLHWPHQALEK